MEIRQISYFNEFICKGCECPETCCRGWLIPLEKEDLERYSKEKGLMKARLMLAMSEHSIPVFNSSCGECTFHERSGLCSLQVKRGHDFIPETCRNYPRFYRNYGLFEERYLDLSCIEAANMLISHVKDLSLVLAMGEPDCDKTITNDDEPFLNRLLRIRSDMQSALAGVTDFDDLCSVLGAIDSYAMRLQDAYLHGDEDYPDKHPFTYQTIFAVSDDETRFFMNGVFFEKKNDNLNLVATDGRRLAFSSKPLCQGINDFSSAIVPPKILNIILKRAPSEGFISIAIVDKVIFIKFGNYQFTSVLIDGQFPNYMRLKISP